MKRLFGLSVLLAGILLAGCSGKGNMDLAVGSADIDYTSDRAFYGLLGPVKSVEYQGDFPFTVLFAEDGSQIESGIEETHFEGRTRYDSIYFSERVSVFDDLGRIVSCVSPDGSSKFTYKGNQYFPIAEDSEFHDYDADAEIVSAKYSYNAADFDSHGNWLSRKEDGKTVTRTITYYQE